MGVELGQTIGPKDFARRPDRGLGLLEGLLWRLGAAVLVDVLAPPRRIVAQEDVPLLDRELDMVEDRHRDHPVAPSEVHAADALGGARAEHAHAAAGREADAFAALGREQHVVRFRGHGDADQVVALVQAHRDLAVRGHEDEVGERVAPDLAARGREHDRERVVGALVLGQRQDGRDRLAVCQLREQVDHRLAARLRIALRQPVDLELVDATGRAEEQDRRVGHGDEQLGQEVVVVGRHADPALAAAALLAIGRKRRPLDVAKLGHRDDHVLLLDQVLDVDVVVFAGLEGGAPGRRKALA